MWVLGINWQWHDSSAAIVDSNGKLVAFAEEERFTRAKHAFHTFPTNAATHCLRVAGIGWHDVDVVAIGWEVPKLMLEYPKDMVLGELGMAEAWDDSMRNKLYSILFGSSIPPGDRVPELVFVEHHIAHALSSFYASGFDRAGVLVVDGSGESKSISIYDADRTRGLILKRDWNRTRSLGSMYDAATRSIGYSRMEAGKTMGLASYADGGEAEILPIGDLIEETQDERSPTSRLSITDRYEAVTRTWMAYFEKQFGPVSAPAEKLSDDTVARRIAGSAQRTLETAIRALYSETVCSTASGNICLAGGVALNCVANGLLPDPIYVPPFPHDAGVAVGAAWSICPPREPRLLETPYLGSDVNAGRLIDQARHDGLSITGFAPDIVVRLLQRGSIGAVVEGRAEVGPRALGHRSIVSLPDNREQRVKINVVKAREQWRPLAPVTTEEYAASLWPRQGLRELYMVGSATVSAHARDVMPAAVHVDGSTRPQTLPRGNALVLDAIFEELRSSGLPPVLINTSFNTRGEPIVNSAADAFRAFQDLGLDFLVLGDALLLSNDEFIRHLPGRK